MKGMSSRNFVVLLSRNGLFSRGKQGYLISTVSSGSSVLGQQSVSPEDNIISPPSCPQGIQGDNDANLKIWFDTCSRYGLKNCQNQLQQIQSGRKTLSQVFAEQDALIEIIAKHYKSTTEHRKYESIDGIQGIDQLPSLDVPCPQGVQGNDCAQFQLWLKNCHRFGFSNCMDLLDKTKMGHKSLADIFREQDNQIRSVVTQFQQKRSYSTSSKSSDNPNSSNGKEQTSTDLNDNIVKLSQKDRLKKAVKEYGSTVIVFHVCISLVSLGGFYVAVSSGLDVVGILTKLGVGDGFLKSKDLATAGTFVAAYAVHKVFAPVRIGITLTSVPLIVRYLRRIGFLKATK